MERMLAHCVAVFYASRAMALLLLLSLMVSNCGCLSRFHVLWAEFRGIYHSLYIVPGSSAPLKRICLGENNLLLIYDDQRARLWDTKTKQLWRSMALEKAEELITQGRWSDLYVVHLFGFAFLKLSSLRLWRILERGTCLPETFWAPVADSFEGPDAGTIYLFRLLAQNLRIFY